MRTPNAECILCKKPLYRRPWELKKTRYAACMNCRAKAQSVVGVTDKQKIGLAIGQKATENNRIGFKHREESKRKASESHKQWCAENPDLVAARSVKIRGHRSYNWKGGITALHHAVRSMANSDRWKAAVKRRDDYQCVDCGSTHQLECHHLHGVAAIIEAYGITSLEAARDCPELWNVDNGVALCRKCHYARHERTYNDTWSVGIYEAPAPSA